MRYPMVWQFIGAFAVGSTIMVSAAFAWPYFTKNPRPEFLNTVRSVMGTTDIGRNMANVLGVTDGKQVEPINVASVAAISKKIIIQTIETQAQEIVHQKVVDQILNVWQTLPEPDKQDIQKQICQPQQ